MLPGQDKQTAPGQFAAAKKRKMSTALLMQQRTYHEAQVCGRIILCDCLLV